MRFYTQQHQHYCGIDLHARTMYLCILNPAGEVLLYRNLRATPEAFHWEPRNTFKRDHPTPVL